MLCLCSKNLSSNEGLPTFPRSFQHILYADSSSRVDGKLVFFSLAQNGFVFENTCSKRPSFLPYLNQTLPAHLILKSWDEYSSNGYRSLLIEGFDSQNVRRVVKVEVSNPRTDCGHLIFDSQNDVEPLTNVSILLDPIREQFTLVNKVLSK